MFMVSLPQKIENPLHNTAWVFLDDAITSAKPRALKESRLWVTTVCFFLASAISAIVEIQCFAAVFIAVLMVSLLPSSTCQVLENAFIRKEVYRHESPWIKEARLLMCWRPSFVAWLMHYWINQHMIVTSNPDAVGTILLQLQMKRSLNQHTDNKCSHICECQCLYYVCKGVNN